MWHEFTHHEFVELLGDGSLSLDAYKRYMIQDYLYLVSTLLQASHRHRLTMLQIHFARANALAGYKVKNADEIATVRKVCCCIRFTLLIPLGRRYGDAYPP